MSRGIITRLFNTLSMLAKHHAIVTGSGASSSLGSQIADGRGVKVGLFEAETGTSPMTSPRLSPTTDGTIPIRPSRGKRWAIIR